MFAWVVLLLPAAAHAAPACVCMHVCPSVTARGPLIFVHMLWMQRAVDGGAGQSGKKAKPSDADPAAAAGAVAAAAAADEAAAGAPAAGDSSSIAVLQLLSLCWLV